MGDGGLGGDGGDGELTGTEFGVTQMEGPGIIPGGEVTVDLTGPT